MGTNLATKTKKIMKHGQKISPQTNVSCLPFLPETHPKHKTKTLSTGSTNREDYHSITIKVRSQNIPGSNHSEK